VRPTVLGKTIDAETATMLTRIMEQVVERGTATDAQIDGYAIAGKTGTAHKLVNGRYSNTDYYASFVGFLPSRDPVVAIIVVIDSPHERGHFGGPIAGPVFQRIGQAALRHFGIAPTLNAPSPILVARRSMPSEVSPTGIVRGASIVPVGAPGALQVLPDFRGLSAREVVRILTKMGLSVRLHGSGMVVNQSPRAGTSIDSGGICELWLVRAPVALASLDR
jgi:membrane peptidoglycan carboxypeptidase